MAEGRAAPAAPPTPAAPLLEVQGLACGWGEATVLSEVGFTVEPGRSLALLGRNGSGKTTLIETLVGVARRHAGTIRLAGREIQSLPPRARAALGLGWVPQERSIFKSLTVAENLSAVARPGPWTAARVFELFPRLAERRGNLGTQLSGGEQQMLAFGRALMLNPKLLLLDEPLEGLAPIIVHELLQAIRRVARDEGLPAIVVEQHPHLVLGVTDDALVLDRGGIACRARSASLLADPSPLHAWLGVAAH
ncbi:MAG: ATP-binding cassette domain-containing protein [Burkholderiales bacterium]|nr:ATP-binding cassette domain-containing protein [Burkholderiales bacterium]